MTTNHGHENHGQGNEEPRNPGVEFDRTDLGARGILIFFLVLGVFGLLASLAVVGLYMGMTKIAEKHEPEVSPLARNVVTPAKNVMMNTADVNAQRFPQPRLQNDDTGDMERFLLKETTTLAAKPWQDAQGNVHLPIEQAMKVVVSRLPVRAGGETAPPDYPGAKRQYSYSIAQANGTGGQDGALQSSDASPVENQLENESKQENPTPERK